MTQKKSRFDGAISAASADIRLDPETVRVHVAGALLKKGCGFLASGQFDQAHAHLSEALSLKPGDYEVNYYWAQLLRRQGRFDEAAAAYEQTIALDPERMDGYLSLATCRLYQNDLKNVDAVLRRADARRPLPKPEDVRSWAKRFRVAVGLCDYAQVERIGEAILDVTRKTRDLRPLLWSNISDDHDPMETSANYINKQLDSLDRYVKARPLSAWGWYYRGLWRSLMKRYDSKMEKLSLDDITRQKDFSKARYGWMRYERALGFFLSYEFVEAIEEFRIVAAASEPGDWRAQCFIAEALVYLGDFKGAMEAVAAGRKMTWSDDQLGQLLAWQGELLLWVGDYEEALTIFDSAPLPKAPFSHCWRGATLMKLGRLDEALAELDAAIALKPVDVESRIWRAETFYRRNQFKEAVEASDAAIEVRIFNFYMHVVRGLACGALGDFHGMRLDLERVPRRIVDYVCAKSGLLADSPESIMKILELILTLSKGVRRGGHEVRAWMGSEWKHR